MSTPIPSFPASFRGRPTTSNTTLGPQSKSATANSFDAPDFKEADAPLSEICGYINPPSDVSKYGEPVSEDHDIDKDSILVGVYNNGLREVATADPNRLISLKDQYKKGYYLQKSFYSVSKSLINQGFSTALKKQVDSPASISTSKPVVTKENAQEVLFQAVVSGDIDKIQSAIDAGANINSTSIDPDTIARGLHPGTTYTKDTPLYLASYAGSIPVVDFLIKKGAIVDMACEGGMRHGMTPLMIASRFGRNEIVQLLLQNKADTNIKGFNGATALYEACWLKGHFTTAKLLIDAGANINHATASGFTALMCVANVSEYDNHKDKCEIVKLLLDLGVAVGPKNYYKKSALDIAKECKNAETVKLIEDYLKKIAEDLD